MSYLIRAYSRAEDEAMTVAFGARGTVLYGRLSGKRSCVGCNRSETSARDLIACANANEERANGNLPARVGQHFRNDSAAQGQHDRSRNLDLPG